MGRPDGPAVADTLATLRRPGGGRLVGIRHQVHDEPDAALALPRRVRRGLAAVGRPASPRPLSGRASCPRRSSRRAAPPLRFGSITRPSRRSRGAVEPWARASRVRRARPTSPFKLSGLVTEANWRTWRSATSLRTSKPPRPFGPERRSSAPTGRCACSPPPIADVVAAAQDLTAGLSAHRTCGRLRRRRRDGLPGRPPAPSSRRIGSGQPLR